MRTPVCDLVGCELPIFAFSHCRDVVAAVSRTGGFGVLGASTISPEQLEVELTWLDEHCGGRAYGVDLLIPARYDERADRSPAELEALIPSAHRAFLDGILDDAGVPPLPDEVRDDLRAALAAGRGAMTPDGARRLLDVVLDHPRVSTVVGALGTPPADVVELLRGRGVVVGALCGAVRHARRQVDAGVQLIVAQGTEAGGHTGDVATMVLVPEVVDAADGRACVLAAGGISNGRQVAAALALGAQGVWCGTVWLGTRESELDDFERQILFDTPTEGTVRRRARTGKPVRMVRSELSEAWGRPDAPEHLPNPLQGVLYGEAHARVVRARRPEYWSFPAGQSVGALHAETSAADVVYRLQTELTEALEHLTELTEG